MMLIICKKQPTTLIKSLENPLSHASIFRTYLILFHIRLLVGAKIHQTSNSETKSLLTEQKSILFIPLKIIDGSNTTWKRDLNYDPSLLRLL